MILGSEETRTLIDFTEPVGLLAVAILQSLGPADDAVGLMARYRDALPAGSFFAASHATQEGVAESVLEQGNKAERLRDSMLGRRGKELTPTDTAKSVVKDCPRSKIMDRLVRSSRVDRMSRRSWAARRDLGRCGVLPRSGPVQHEEPREDPCSRPYEHKG